MPQKAIGSIELMAFCGTECVVDLTKVKNLVLIFFVARTKSPSLAESRPQMRRHRSNCFEVFGFPEGVSLSDACPALRKGTRAREPGVLELLSVPVTIPSRDDSILLPYSSHPKTSISR
ncbi:hypothetical protein EVAR_31150_1 [Eumeta japonica]|uniref:Uncharacterized protein n=1 Tax=Eumeta variegata TaxID=151549 RepID=A0A4C1VZK1_EUMVA|nr:hypothetical protein EVAR_31150_1 [Eumeta japonica]